MALTDFTFILTLSLPYPHLSDSFPDSFPRKGNEERAPVLTGGILGSFWKHRKDSKTKKSVRKSPRNFSREVLERNAEADSAVRRKSITDL